jgi:hypothetical protein
MRKPLATLFLAATLAACGSPHPPALPTHPHKKSCNDAYWTFTGSGLNTKMILVPRTCK